MRKQQEKNSFNVGNNDLRVLSLFSGGGGMDIGLEGGFIVPRICINEDLADMYIDSYLSKDLAVLRKTRFKTVFANDIFKDARNCWTNYFSKRGVTPKIFRSESIVDLVRQHKMGNKIFPDDIDVVTGGFPCQDFSVAGKRNGFSSHKNHKGELIVESVPTIETRGMLYMWMKEVIEITQPKIFIAENVKGLVNLDDVKDVIQKDFASAGKNGFIVLSPRVLHAADYGVPQSRERVIFIGINKRFLSKELIKVLDSGDIPIHLDPYPKPTHAYTESNDSLPASVKLRSIFRLLKEPEHSSDISQQHYSKAKYMGAHCQGQTEVKIDSIGPTIRAEHHGNIEYRRLSLDRGGKLEKEITQGKVERRLTVRECGLIQTFPIDYEFVIPSTSKGKFIVSPSQAYKVIGNAVPPLLAFNIAIRLEELWNTFFENHGDDKKSKNSRVREAISESYTELK